MWQGHINYLVSVHKDRLFSRKDAKHAKTGF